MKISERNPYAWGLKKRPSKNSDELILKIKKTLEISSPFHPFENAVPVNLSPSKIQGPLLKEFLKVTKVSIENSDRIFYSLGRSLPDLVRLKSGLVEYFPDIIAFPSSEKEIIETLKLCNLKKYAVVPWGGGTSVVGGTSSIKITGYKALVCLSMENMNRPLDLDEKSMTALFECGIQGPDLEGYLNSRGFTMGHFPQSFEFSSLGGWIASKGAGYYSERYGKIENMVLSCRMISPSGPSQTRFVPSSSEGPELNEIFCGSEGVLGILSKAEVKIHPLEKNLIKKSYLIQDYSKAVELLRQFKIHHVSLHLVRLSDPQETFYYTTVQRSSDNSISVRLQNKILSVLGFHNPSLLIVEGNKEGIKMMASLDFFRSTKKIPLGSSPVKKWYESRYITPYLRDDLLNEGVAADTFETSASWKNLNKLREEVYKAVSDLKKKYKRKYILMSHISHVHDNGASLYFTIVYPLTNKGSGFTGALEILKQWQIMKKTVTETIVKNKGALSHHHGIGTDHLDWINYARGKLETEILRNIKKTLDPKGIMNPGKLL